MDGSWDGGRRPPSAVRRLFRDQFDLIIVPPMKLREAQEGTPVAECRPRWRALWESVEPR